MLDASFACSPGLLGPGWRLPIPIPIPCHTLHIPATYSHPIPAAVDSHLPTITGPAPPRPVLQRERYRSFRIRFISSVVLIGSFVAIIYAGHVPLMFMILGIQVGADWEFSGC